MIAALVVAVDQIEAVNRSRWRSCRVIAGILVQTLFFAGPTFVLAGGVVVQTLVVGGGLVVQILVRVGEEQRCCHMERGTADCGCCSCG